MRHAQNIFCNLRRCIKSYIHFPYLGSSRSHEKKFFVNEIEVMKRVSDGNSPHVLKMLGCVTTSFPMMLVLQFVPHGNLKDYLRAMNTVDGVGNNNNY